MVAKIWAKIFAKLFRLQENFREKYTWFSQKSLKFYTKTKNADFRKQFRENIVYFSRKFEQKFTFQPYCSCTVVGERSLLVAAPFLLPKHQDVNKLVARKKISSQKTTVSISYTYYTEHVWGNPQHWFKASWKLQLPVNDRKHCLHFVIFSYRHWWQQLFIFSYFRSNFTDDGELCVPQGLAKNYTMCDGRRLSGARINRCGVCWGGSTGRNESAGDCTVYTVYNLTLRKGL
jgi:hypothetical protein